MPGLIPLHAPALESLGHFLVKFQLIVVVGCIPSEIHTFMELRPEDKAVLTIFGTFFLTFREALESLGSLLVLLNRPPASLEVFPRSLPIVFIETASCGYVPH